MKTINEKLNEMRENYNSCIKSAEKIENALKEGALACAKSISNQEIINNELVFIVRNINKISDGITTNFFRMNDLFILNQKYS